MSATKPTREGVRALAARLRALLPERAEAPAAAVTFVDEDGESTELPAEFATATMGHILLGQGRRDAARAVFASVLARTPDDASALHGMTRLTAV